MRRPIALAALLAAIAAGACTDTAPTPTGLRPDGVAPLMQSGLNEEIETRILDYFPKGLETSTGTKWETVKSKLEAGDEAEARKHLNSLVDWVTKKTPEITPKEDDVVAGEPEDRAKERAAARLTLYMAVYVYKGASTPLPPVGKDVAFKLVPAGEAATIVTPSKHAAVDIDAGSTDEDRIITVIQDPNPWPGHCNGPLPTKLCQYPLFYDISSFPNKNFKKMIGVAVCMVTSGDRTPLDNPALDPPKNTEVHERLRLARPFSGGEGSPTGTPHPEGNPTIEILEIRATQKGLTDCSDIPTPTAFVTPRGGWLGRAQRGMLAIANFTARMLTPKDLYAFDVGPEHETIGLGGSPMNAVDPGSKPDLTPTGLAAPSEVLAGAAVSFTYNVSNTSRRSGGLSTGVSEATTANVYLVREDDSEGDVGLTAAEKRLLKSGVPIGALRPDDTPVAITGSNALVTIPADVSGSWFLEVEVAGSPGLPEADLDNNVARIPVTVFEAVFNYGFDDGGTTGWSPGTISTAPVGEKFLGEFSSPTEAAPSTPSTATLTLGSIGPHSQVEIAFDLYLMNTWDGNRNTDEWWREKTGRTDEADIAPDIFALRVDGSTKFSATFAVIDVRSWQSYPAEHPEDLNLVTDCRDGVSPRDRCNANGTGAQARDLGYAMHAVYRITKTVPHTARSLTLSFTSPRLQGIADESWGIDNVKVTLIP